MIAILSCFSAAQAQNSAITLRSGNGIVGGTDSAITVLVASDAGSPFPNTFTPADFTNAGSGTAASIVPYSNFTIAEDPQARWVATNNIGGGTGLFAINFTLGTVPTVASLTLHYAVDNELGGGPNGALYINGTQVPGIGSPVGGFGQEYSLYVSNIASLLKPGVNTLYINAANLGGPAALIFSADITTTVTPPAYTWMNFAGQPNPNVSGTADGSGTMDQFNYPKSTAVDSSGNVYVADTQNQTIREITPSGVVTTIAGTAGVSGTLNSTGTAAQFYNPSGIAVDGSGNVYVADTQNQMIREIAPGGVVTTLAGTAGVSGTLDSTGTAAQFFNPSGVAVDGSGNVYVADTQNQTIREITQSGVVTTIAGMAGVSGTLNSTGTAAQFYNPSGVAVDASGNVYVADTQNQTIREIAPGGVVTTIAGTPGVSGTSNGTGVAAQFYNPSAVAVDGLGNLYVTGSGSQTVREVTPGGNVWTIGGTPGTSGTQGGVGALAGFDDPQGIAVSSTGSLYVADSGNNRIAVGLPGPLLFSPAASGTVTTPVPVIFSLPQQALPGSVQLTFDNGVNPVVLTLSSSEEAAGQSSFSFDPANPTASSAVVGISGGASIPPGSYTVTLSYQDLNADPVQSASSANVTISPAVPSVSTPATSGTVYSPISVTFTLPGQADPGSVQLTFDNGGGTPIVLTLTSAYEGAGAQGGVAQILTLNPASPGGAYGVASVTGGTSIPAGVYTVTLGYQDFAGDPAQSASVANVAVDPVYTYGNFDVNSYSGYLEGFIRYDYVSSSSNVVIVSGTDTTYGTTTPLTTNYYSGNGYGYVYYAYLSGLMRDTTYHYQAEATINGTTYYGGDQTFTTTHDDPPTANSDTYYLPLNKTQPVTLNVLANDTVGNPFDTLSIISFSHPSGGRLQITGGGTTLQYTPSSRYSGNDSFTYTISTNYGETSTATVYIRDPYLDFAGNFQGLISGSVPGYVTLTLGTQGSFTGSVRVEGGTYTFAGSFNSTGNAVLSLTGKNLPAATLALNVNATGGGTFTYALTIPGGGTETGSFTQKVLYSTTNPAPQAGTYTIIVQPPALGTVQQAYATATESGGLITKITMNGDGYGYVSTPAITVTGSSPKGKGAAFVPVINSSGEITAINVSKPGSGYTNPLVVTISPPSGMPQGYGWATMKVTPTGAVTMTGKLADGTAFTAGSWIDADYVDYSFSGFENPYAYTTPTFPIFAGVYTAPVGYLYGTMYFEDNTGVSDLDSRGNNLTWYKPAQSTAQLYKGGFNLNVTMQGSFYVDPVTDYLLDLQSISGNAQVSLSGGTLPSTLLNLVTLPQAPTTAASLVSGSSDSISLTQAPATGAFAGKFSPTGASANTSFSGVMFQKSNFGYGFLTGTTESGSVVITPQ